MTRWGRLADLILTVKLGVLVVNALTFPRLRRGRARSLPKVSLLVPARDEAENLRVNLPGLLAQGAYEVLVLDDGSQDQTALVAASLGMRVMTGQPLPAGWTGKNWACWQLAQAAEGDFLIFTDADVTWESGALDAVVAEMARLQADLLSVFPRQHNVTWGERLLTPLVDDVLLSSLPAPLLRLPQRLASAANGQVMAFRREPYEALGGHRAVRANLLEDVALARRVKTAGGSVALALGQDLIGVRMYRSYPESVQGFAKSLPAFHGGSRFLLLLSLGASLMIYTLPLVRRKRSRLALGLLEGALVRAVTGRLRPADLAEVLLTPLLPVLSIPVYALALRRRVYWKRRSYGPEQRS